MQSLYYFRPFNISNGNSMTSSHPFPVDEWRVREDSLDLEHNTHAETLFALANGYIGTRGTFEEGVAGNPLSCEGTYLNGVFLREKIHYEEIGYGFATHNNKMIQVPNGKSIALEVDGERFTIGESTVEDYSRILDFRTGTLERSARWKTQSGKTLEIKSKRLVSLEEKHLLGMEYQITAVNFSGEVQLTSSLDAAYGEQLEWDENDPRIAFLSIKDSLDKQASTVNDATATMTHLIKGGKTIIHTTCAHVVTDNIRVAQGKSSDNRVDITFTLSLKEGEHATLHKYVTYHDGVKGEEEGLIKASEALLSKATANGFAFYADVQKAKLDAFWKHADVHFSGDSPLQQGMRFNLFHIFQSAGRDGKRNIGAKGLTGPGYDGHYFWDTEIYIIPFFVFNRPEIARSLLQYRHSILDAARAHARDLNQPRGALYAWRTIGGEECSAYFPAGSAQYHINAAVAYAIRQYYTVTGDWDFICNYGAEMLFETARIWADMGFFCAKRGGAFCINQVTGPDEYSAMADNNFYTNSMARMHLRFAARMADKLKAESPEVFVSLSKAIDLKPEEVEKWKKAAEAMYLPTDPELGVSPQDDTFLTQPVWDFKNTPKNKYPLLMHFHPLFIYRHQVLKQADVVLAMVLLGEEFSDELKTKNLAYYNPLTTHDSTLSTSMYSVAASEIGQYDLAYEFLGDSVRMDLDNSHHNTEYGLHTACMAGSWMSIVMGFGGMRVHDERLHFSPHLPKKWQGYGFSVLFRGQRVHVSVHPDSVTYQLTEGTSIFIVHDSEEIVLTPEVPVKLSAVQHAA